jgi:L-asparaginase
VSVVVLTTGGTVASGRSSADGPIAPIAGLDVVGAHLDPTVHVRAVMAVDSSTMSLERMVTIRDALTAALTEPGVEGVVVLHGTDTLEETAMLLDLFHDDARPVALTGAQRPADHPSPDGPGNINAAVQVVRRADARDRGVLIVFGDRILPARGARKAHTTRLDAFERYLPESDSRRRVLPWHAEVAHVRVDIVTLYPGSDRTHIDASVAAGARGVVLEAMGSGNGNPSVLAAVDDCIANGVAVVVTSRVPHGVIEPLYGGTGGGRDLTGAGAIFSQWLRAGQARIMLAALLAAGADTDRMASAFSDVIGLGADDRTSPTG